jgi:CRP/FNR family transcriptional regulator, anaerobic regulatory protein
MTAEKRREEMVALHHATVTPIPPAPALFDAWVAARAVRPDPVRAERCEAGDIIFWQGDEATSAYLIESGVVRLCRLMADGRRAILGFLFAGESLGLAVRAFHGYTAEAVTDVELRRLPLSQIHAAAADSPELGQRYLAIMSDELAAAQDRLLLLGRMTAMERIASFLLEVARRTGARQRVALPMSRLDIADYLGLTLETVSRMLSKLKRDGVIGLPHPQIVELLHMGEIKHLAGLDEDELAAAA